jgi:hypothetical protein
MAGDRHARESLPRDEFRLLFLEQARLISDELAFAVESRPDAIAARTPSAAIAEATMDSNAATSLICSLPNPVSESSETRSCYFYGVASRDSRISTSHLDRPTF